MRVLIVDDENHVREGIKLLGAWEENGITEIYEAGNGEEAIAYIREYKPEIIFSDMKMPRMDGTKLLEWIKEHAPTSKTIVVTGYDDYHYMRKAIHFGSSDYLLKPVDPEILNHTLQNVTSEWKKEESERKKSKSSYQLMNEMKPVYRDRKLTQLINSDTSNEDLYEAFGFHPSGKYNVALVRVSARTIVAFHGDRDLTYFTILNVINEILMEKECGIGFRYLSNKGEIVIVFWDHFSIIPDVLSKISRTISEVMEVSCSITLGKSVETSAKLLDSYHHAKQVLLHSNVLTQQKVHIQEKIPEDSLKSLMTYSQAIELAMQTGEIRAFEELVEQIAADYTAGEYLSYQQLLHLENEYLIISNRWFKNYKITTKIADSFERRIDLHFDRRGNFQMQAYKARKLREIAVFLKKVKRTAAQKGNNVIREIEKYLQKNYDRDVKLQEISDHFYISREYISRKFKQEYSVNISDYIVAIRMERAKSLLKNSALKIYEIAAMIGYQDDKYFRKVFKKVVGITPNEYRDKHTG